VSALQAATAELERLAAELPTAPGAIRLVVDGEIAELVLDAASTRNALTAGMMAQLGAAVMSLRTWRGAGVILRAEGPVFCAGGHLGQVRAGLGTPERGGRMARSMAVVLDALADLPSVSIAAIHGHAIGGGAELVTATDLRVMAPGATVHFAQGRLGVAAGWGGAARLTRLVGRSAAVTVLLDAARVSAARARELGLADAVDEEPASWARRRLEGWLGAVPATAMRALKAQVVAASPGRAGDAEASAFVEVWGGPAHRDALARTRRRT
jgi:ethylmalonyl-CoA/methylmalonyl-CoA decarboxylase